METTAFRPATLDDVDEIVSLINICYRGDSSRQGWTTEADLLDGTRTDHAEIQTLITTAGSAILLCADGDELVGSVHVQRQGDSCYLGLLVVRPGLQGAGVGRKVIEAAEDHARRLWKSTKMTMTVITVRPELLAWYERRGYRRTGEIRPFAFDESHGIPRVEGLELEVLEKELS